jgi:hypothetical protein
MSASGGGGNDLAPSSSSRQVSMNFDMGLAPGVNVTNTAFSGVIPAQLPHVQNLPPAAVLNAIPSRVQVLQEALQLCSASPATRDDKMDLLLAMMTSMFKLMLLDHVVGPSGGSSPFSLRQSGSNSSASSGGGPSSPHLGPDFTATAVTAVAHFQASTQSSSGSAVNAGAPLPGQSHTAAALQKKPAAAHFICPTCPSGTPPLTEKSFNKHIEAWKLKVRRPQGGVSARKVKGGSCPGIRSLNHPLIAGLEGSIETRVDTVADHTKGLLTPGASAAHTPAGTGNYIRVQEYFAQLQSLHP